MRDCFSKGDRFSNRSQKKRAIGGASAKGDRPPTNLTLSQSFRGKLDMSIIGILKQITPYMLDTLKKNPVFVSLLLNSHWMSDDLDYSEYIQSHPFTSLKDKDELKQLQDFERKYPDKFEKIKVDISVESESELDLDKYYDSIHYLLTWDTRFSLPYLVTQNSGMDELPLVNAIFGSSGIGYETDDYGEVTYLTSKEVKQIAKALQEITRKGFRERYKRAAKIEEPVCFIDWEEKEMLSWLTHYYNEITFYYKDAARKNNAMLIYFS